MLAWPPPMRSSTADWHRPIEAYHGSVGQERSCLQVPLLHALVPQEQARKGICARCRWRATMPSLPARGHAGNRSGCGGSLGWEVGSLPTGRESSIEKIKRTESLLRERINHSSHDGRCHAPRPSRARAPATVLESSKERLNRSALHRPPAVGSGAAPSELSADCPPGTPDASSALAASALASARILDRL